MKETLMHHAFARPALIGVAVSAAAVALAGPALAATSSTGGSPSTGHASSTHAPGTLTVATTGADSGNCQSGPCKTLGYALTQASPNDKIVIQPGTYRESGNVNVVRAGLTGLKIASTGSAARTVIDATGNTNGILILASGVSVTGLTVENANLEGILVEPPRSSWPTSPTSAPANISHVTIADNVVEHNDQAFNTSLPADSGCPSSPTDADDCGEGIHLLAATQSQVTGNNVSHNVGGILLSDGGFGISVGPAAHNLIARNQSLDNALDCGITLPGHDPRAVAANGRPQPDLAGVYDNTVVNNVSSGNGGAGLLDAAPSPGTGSYDNVFAGNIANGNGLGGFVLHSHAPQQDVSGIVVKGNRFGQNNLAGDPDTGVKPTTGVILLSSAVPTSIVVTNNTISGNANGVALNSNITAVGHNRFANVTNDYLHYTPPSAS
jgi:Right handed beta helix region